MAESRDIAWIIYNHGNLTEDEATELDNALSEAFAKCAEKGMPITLTVESKSNADPEDE